MLMHSKSDNIEIIINDKANEVIEENFGHFFKVLNWVGNINEN